MYKEILAANPKCALSGSHALHLFGIKLPREPKDIDIFLHSSDNFNPLPGMHTEEDEAEDHSDCTEMFKRTCYKLNGASIDIFECLDTTDEKAIVNNIHTIEGVRCVNYLDILKFKMSFITDGSTSRDKHRADILFIIENLSL